MAADPAADKSWMLYGADGYTGQLIAERCVRDGLRPVLAGRREAAIRPLADRLGLPFRVFSLGSPEEVARQLEDVSAVLLCAGPFSSTSAPVVDACLRTGTSYLDITGEIAVFAAVHARDAGAKRAGCALIPGVGFDVVPSDCLAASLHEALPEATRLELAFRGTGSPSPGTAKTAVEGLAAGGAIRRNGRIVRVPLAWKTRTIPFHDEPRLATTVPWGDVSTAYYSTGIGNVEVYMAMPPWLITATRLARPFGPLLRRDSVQRYLKKRIEACVTGPDEQERRRGRSEFWGRVEAPSGRSVEGTLTTPEGYELTTVTALESVRRVLQGGIGPGALTPSMAFGASFITHFEGCELRIGAPRP